MQNLGQHFALDEQLAVLDRVLLPPDQNHHGEHDQHEGQNRHKHAQDHNLLGVFRQLGAAVDGPQVGPRRLLLVQRLKRRDRIAVGERGRLLDHVDLLDDGVDREGSHRGGGGGGRRALKAHDHGFAGVDQKRR